LKFYFLITAIEIADELLQIGCDQVLNIDYSYPLVKHMTDKTAKDYNPKLEYLCMDVRKMDLQNEVFDIVLDKGTFDCMMCADTSQKHMKEYLNQIFRVLCEGGSYIMVSYGEPPSREKYLRLVRFFRANG
jgi:ubiquinone/menaquinone biosynthesis C-methylase UbiE